MNCPVCKVKNRAGARECVACKNKLPPTCAGCGEPIAEGLEMCINCRTDQVPADFLVDEYGLIRDIWYGRDTSDHIPLKRVDACINGRRKRRVASIAGRVSSSISSYPAQAVAQRY